MADATTTHPELFDEVGGPKSPPSAKAERRKLRKAEKAEKQYKRTPKPIEARTPRQATYIHSILNNELTFGIGPAGVGKTYVPSRLFGTMLASGEIDKIYVARPNVSKASHRQGFLPGTLEEKTAPWLVPIFEGIKDSMGPAEFERARKDKRIEEVPFEFMQGRTFKNAAFIVDEAENLDLDDLYITLTRQGEDCRAVFCGDIYQARIPNSGLAAVVDMPDKYGMESVGVTEFMPSDIVRSRQAKQWAMAFRSHWGGETLREDENCANDAGTSFHENPPEFLKGA